MLRLARYLRPYMAMLLMAIFFIVVQAMSDLALPDYMSRIVNNGIQQGGITNAVPEALRKSQMDRLLLFMTPYEKEAVLESYTLVDHTSDDYERYAKKYPLLSKEPIYVINNTAKERIEQINLPLARAFLAVFGVEQTINSAKDGVIEFNGQKIPANVDPFALISQLPQEQLIKIRDEMNKKFQALGDDAVIQAATMAVKEEYRAIGMDTGRIQTSYILRTGIVMLLITVLSALSTVIVALLSSKIAAGVARNLRKDVFSKVMYFSNAEFDSFSTASLITRSTNDVAQIQMLLVILIRMVFYAPIMGVGGVFRALSKSASMSWIIALAVILLLGLILLLYFIAMPKFKLMQKLIDRINMVMRENLSGIMVVRAFNNQKFEEERFDKANKDVTKVGLFVNRSMAFMFPTMMFIMNGITLLIVWVGAKQIENSSMRVGDMMAFMQYAMQIMFAFLMLSMLFVMIPRASVSAQRIAEVLDAVPSVRDPEKPKELSNNVKGMIEFRNVSFKYPGAEEYTLKDVSFKIMPGQMVGIIGRTGCGKSTVVNLLLRFYDATQGQVLIDGLDVREVKQEELRKRIGYVPQKSWLFTGTIESNLKYGNDGAGMDDLEEAVKIAQALEFINERPDRFEAEIAQGGTNVSGGQKQRLCIARALVKKPEIYIFDESFSALDFKTEAALRRNLRERLRSSTVIMVSQRVSTLFNADQIIVLEEGRVVGIGRHRELMKTCQTYRDIALSQLPEEELA